MLSQRENELLTRTGPGTPGGELLRRYWQPVAISEEMPVGGSPRPVRILGEDLVLFRDDQDRLGLLGLHCPHRGTDLSYGRVENGGLRCLYHGWMFDIDGNCLEMPGEPAGHDFCKKVRHLSYPCMEESGFILTYMGPGEPPLLPNYEHHAAPESHKHSFKYFQDCNYLQCVEGNLDPVHVSFVHHMADEDARRAGRVIKIGGTTEGMHGLVERDLAPSLDVEETDFGLRIYTVRNVGPDSRWVRTTNFIMPNNSSSPAGTGEDGYTVLWHVPIDDEHHWKYQINYKRSAPIENKARLQQSITGETTGDYRMARNLGNRFLQDREEMKTGAYAGLGPHFGAHDAVAIWTAGAIFDRTKEHLGTTDKAIIHARGMLLDALQQVREGTDPLHVVRDSAANDFSHLVVKSRLLATDSEEWRTIWAQRVPDELRETPG